MKNFADAARPIVMDSLGLIVFAGLLALHVNLVVATVAGSSLAIGLVLYNLVTRRPVGALRWMSLALVVTTATMTLLTNDPRYVMAKGTVAYSLVGVVMLRRGWLIPYVPPIVREQAPDLLTRYGYVWAGVMFVTAVANLVIAVAFTAWWPLFVAVFPLASKALVFAIQFVILRATITARVKASNAPGAVAPAIQTLPP